MPQTCRPARPCKDESSETSLLSMTVSTHETQSLLGRHSSTVKQNDVTSLNNARASAFTNNVLIIFFVSLIVQGPPQLFLFP